jgi:hypothetical protein
LLSPEARDLLLDVKYKFNSFERQLWQALCKSQRAEFHQSLQNPEQRTIYCTPPLAANKREFDDDLVGSGRNRRDAMHSVGPFIAIKITRGWPLGERLHAIAVGAMLAAAMRIGLAISWILAGNDCCDIHLDDLINFKLFPQATDIDFVKVIREEVGSGYDAYFGKHAKERVMLLEDAVSLENAIHMLMTEKKDSIVTKEILKQPPAWSFFDLQAWTDHAASAELEQWMPNGLQTTPDQWPVVVWLGYQIDSLLKARGTSSKEHKAKCKVQAKSMPGSEKARQDKLWAKLCEVFSTSSQVILLCGRPDFWNEGQSRWHEFAQRDDVMAVGMEAMKGVPRQESWCQLEVEDYSLRSNIVGAAMAILKAAPRSKIIADEASWTVNRIKNMKLGATDIFEAKQTSSEPPWKRTRGGVKEWMTSNWQSIVQHVIDNQLDKRVLPYGLCKLIREVSEEMINHSNEVASQFFKKINAGSGLATGCKLGQCFANIKELSENRDAYQKKKGKLVWEQKVGVWGWLKAVVTFRVNPVRHMLGQPPILFVEQDTLQLGVYDAALNSSEVVKRIIDASSEGTESDHAVGAKPLGRKAKASNLTDS